MQLTHSSHQAWALGAIGLGVYLAARAMHSRSSFDFEGKSVVITGGSRGLGLVLGRQLAGEGARVTLIARDQDELDRASGDLSAYSSSAEVLTIRADVRKREEVERAIAQAAPVSAPWTSSSITRVSYRSGRSII